MIHLFIVQLLIFTHARALDGYSADRLAKLMLSFVQGENSTR